MRWCHRESCVGREVHVIVVDPWTNFTLDVRGGSLHLVFVTTPTGRKFQILGDEMEDHEF